MLTAQNRILKPVTKVIGSCWIVVCCISAATNAVFAQNGPICPGPDSAIPHPAYADVGGAPSVGSWKALNHLPAECFVATDGSVKLTVSLAATFSFDGTVEDIAARLGAVSQTQGLKYWSTTASKWRVLVKKATALESANKKSARSDFTAGEVLSGKTLYFAQSDTRSWGLNVFSFSRVAASADRLIVTSQNIRAIRLGPLKLFGSGDLQSAVFISRADGNNWHYYSLAAVKDSSVAAPVKSLVNRQMAFYRFLLGQQSDKEPPLMP